MHGQERQADEPVAQTVPQDARPVPEEGRAARRAGQATWWAERHQALIRILAEEVYKEAHEHGT